MERGERRIMAPLITGVGVFILLVSLTLVLAACGGVGSAAGSSRPKSAPAGPGTQTSEGGNVTIKVTWNGAADGPTFTVAMDTHSVDLDSYDLRQLAVLKTSQGLEVQPSGWDAPKGGHHREGTLRFPATGPNGQPLIGVGTGTLELVIRDVAGVPERIFQWTS